MGAPLKVTGIDHVVLHVRDLARSKKFYIDLLGMTADQEYPWGIFLHCGSQMVALFEVDKGERIHAGEEMNHMALRLKAGSYKEVKRVLEEAGIKVSGRRGEPRCIYFSDPDGHRLQLLPLLETAVGIARATPRRTRARPARGLPNGGRHGL